MKKVVRVPFVIVIFLSLLLILISTASPSLVSTAKMSSNEEIIQEQTKSRNIENVASSSELSNYTLDLLLDTQNHYLFGNMTFDFVNSEDISIDKLFFHLYPNGSEYEETPGYMLINAVKTGDKQQDLSYDYGYQLLNVTLPQSVLPNESFSLWIEFETAITNNQSYRLTYGDEPGKGLVYALCNYYPILAVYDKDGWNLEPLYFIGDPFYSDLANYYVNLTVPTGFKVASSGQLLSETNIVDQTEYQYQLLRARDFSFAISPDYYLDTGSYGDIEIFVYYLQFDSVNWTNAKDQAIYSLDLYTELYGSYAYPTFTVASTYGFYGGMEWPGLVYVQAGYSYVETAIAHETAHEWFYAVVGNDQIDEGFLDEGIVCYNHWYYFEERYNWKGFFEDHLWRTAERNDITIFPEGLIINRSINEIVERGLDPQYYWETAYHKAPSVYHLLRTYIGDDNFFNALRRYYTLYSFQTATFNDLIDCFNYYSDIEWFLPWFNEGFIPEIEIVSVAIEEYTTTGYNLSLKLQQTGVSTYAAKIPFLITFSDNSESLIWVWCNDSNPITSYHQFDKKPISLKIDPTSGYLYNLDLLLMDPLPIYGTVNGTPGLLILSTLIALLISSLIYQKKRRQ